MEIELTDLQLRLTYQLIRQRMSYYKYKEGLYPSEKVELDELKIAEQAFATAIHKNFKNSY